MAINVNAVNDAPTATNLTQSLTINEDAAATSVHERRLDGERLRQPDCDGDADHCVGRRDAWRRRSAAVNGGNLIYNDVQRDAGDDERGTGGLTYRRPTISTDLRA